METYSNFISQFEIFENPPKKKGYHRHHIVPVCEQIKKYGQVLDNRQVYVTKAQHLWLHVLYDRENETNTRRRLISSSHLEITNINCYEDCISFNDVEEPNFGKKLHHTEEWDKNISKAKKGKPLTEEHKKALSESKKGQIPWNKGKSLTEEHKRNLSKNHWDCHGANSPLYGTHPTEEKESL